MVWCLCDAEVQIHLLHSLLAFLLHQVQWFFLTLLQFQPQTLTPYFLDSHRHHVYGKDLFLLIVPSLYSKEVLWLSYGTCALSIHIHWLSGYLSAENKYRSALVVIGYLCSECIYALTQWVFECRDSFFVLSWQWKQLYKKSGFNNGWKQATSWWWSNLCRQPFPGTSWLDV